MNTPLTCLFVLLVFAFLEFLSLCRRRIHARFERRQVIDSRLAEFEDMSDSDAAEELNHESN